MPAFKSFDSVNLLVVLLRPTNRLDQLSKATGVQVEGREYTCDCRPWDWTEWTCETSPEAITGASMPEEQGM